MQQNDSNISVDVHGDRYPPQKRMRKSNPLLDVNISTSVGSHSDYENSDKSTTEPESSDHASPEKAQPIAENEINAIIRNSGVPSLLAQTINKAISGNVNETQSNDRTLSEQIEAHMGAIMQDTETDPLFDELLNQIYENRVEGLNNPSSESHTPTDTSPTIAVANAGGVEKGAPTTNAEEQQKVNDVASNDTILNRLRPRKEGQRLSALLESPKRPYSKRKTKSIDKAVDDSNKVKIISNEPFLGPLPDFITLPQNSQRSRILLIADGQQTTAGSFYLPNGQQYIIAPSTSTPNQNVTPATTSLSLTDDIPFLIAPTSMCLTTSSSLKPGTIINTSDLQTPILIPNDTVRHGDIICSASSVVSSDQMNVVLAENVDFETVDKNAIDVAGNTVTTVTIEDDKFLAATPRLNQTGNLQNQTRCKSTPRHRHVRVLDFNTPVRRRMKASKIAEEETEGMKMIVMEMNPYLV